jgi:hypothetical protein
MIASSQCKWDGMGVVGGKIGWGRGDDKEYNNPLLDDVEFEMNYHRCEHYAEHPKKGSLTGLHFSLQQPGPPSKKASR